MKQKQKQKNKRDFFYEEDFFSQKKIKRSINVNFFRNMLDYYICKQKQEYVWFGEHMCGPEFQKMQLELDELLKVPYRNANHGKIKRYETILGYHYAINFPYKNIRKVEIEARVNYIFVEAIEVKIYSEIANTQNKYELKSLIMSFLESLVREAMQKSQEPEETRNVLESQEILKPYKYLSISTNIQTDTETSVSEHLLLVTIIRPSFYISYPLLFHRFFNLDEAGYPILRHGSPNFTLLSYRDHKHKTKNYSNAWDAFGIADNYGIDCYWP